MHDVSSRTMDKALNLIAECIGNQANYRNGYPIPGSLLVPELDHSKTGTGKKIVVNV